MPVPPNPPPPVGATGPALLWAVDPELQSSLLLLSLPLSLSLLRRNRCVCPRGSMCGLAMGMESEGDQYRGEQVPLFQHWGLATDPTPRPSQEARPPSLFTSHGHCMLHVGTVLGAGSVPSQGMSPIVTCLLYLQVSAEMPLLCKSRACTMCSVEHVYST